MAKQPGSPRPVSRHTRTRFPLPALVVALVAALLLASCGGGGEATDGDTAGGGNDRNGTSGEPNGQPSGENGMGNGETPPATVEGVPEETGFVGDTEAEGEPQQGGTLTVAVWAEARGVNPTKSPSSGVLGGMETVAIFDPLVRYDPIAKKYEPWMAKSLEHSDDYLTWTLTLRNGVQFSDGTPLDAAAVKFSFEYAQDKRYDKLVRGVASIETPDPQTVVFTLAEPWSRFPWVLSVGPGRVPSPTAVQKWGEKFGEHPVGAGPFVLERFAAGEEIVMSANDNYWGDGPYLDTLRFVPLGGDQARLDSLDAGGAQVAFLRDPDVTASAIEAGYVGYVNVLGASEVLAINNAEGHPGSEPRVRKAIAYATNIEQMNQRVYDGKGLMQKEIMAKTSQWATEAEATPYDLEKAKALVAELKADGVDTAITIASNSAPARKDEALALQAQLNAVGFDASIDYAPSATALYAQLVKGNYDFGFYGISIPDAAPWPKLHAVLHSKGQQNRENYSDPEMDAALDAFHDALEPEAKQQAMNQIQQVWTDTVPMVSLAAIPEFVSWDADKVHGIVPTGFTTVLFSQAWLS